MEHPPPNTAELDVPQPIRYERLLSVPGVHVFTHGAAPDVAGTQMMVGGLIGGALTAPGMPFHFDGMMTGFGKAFFASDDVPEDGKAQMRELLELLKTNPSMEDLRSWMCYPGLAIGYARMTVFELADGSLCLVSPIRLRPEVKAVLDGIGAVKYVVCTGFWHHLFLGDYATAYPDAVLVGPPEMTMKRPDLHWGLVVADHAQPDLQPLRELGIEIAPIPCGMGGMREVAVYHVSSKTLCGGDLIYSTNGMTPTSVWPMHGPPLRFGKVVGTLFAFLYESMKKTLSPILGEAAGLLPAYRVFAALQCDPAAIRYELDFILGKDVQHVIVSHFDTLPLGYAGKDLLAATWGWVDHPRREELVEALRHAYD